MMRRCCDQCEAVLTSDIYCLADEVTIIHGDGGFTAMAQFMVVDETKNGRRYDLCYPCLRVLLAKFAEAMGVSELPR